MIGRDDLVQQSVFDYVKHAIFVVRGYPETQVEIRESFLYELEEPFTKNIICAGFDFDDEGKQAECGSDLKVRVYTIEFWVFGLTDTYARALANAIKFAVDSEGTVPLMDYTLETPVEIDRLVVDGVNADRQIIPEPEPWQHYVWTTRAQLEDTYHAALA